MSDKTTIPMKWADDLQHDHTIRCSCCNRIIKGKFKWVEVIDGGATVVKPGSNPDINDAGYMGFHRVGNTCAKKHFAGFTHEDLGDTN